MSRRTAWSMTSALNLASVTLKRHRGGQKTPGPAVADGLVRRNFTATGQKHRGSPNPGRLTQCLSREFVSVR
jgi:hypothetical protein